MDISIGLPTTLPGVTGSTVLDWAVRAERLGFAAVSVLDRLAHDNLEPVVALTAAAAVTRRIRLATTVLVAPYRRDQAVLVKQLATLASFAPGRLVVGVAAGGRADDFSLTGADFAGRGAALDELVDRLRAVWAGDPDGLAPAAAPGAPPTVLVGGHSPAALRRAARRGDGWVAGGSSAQAYAQRRELAVRAWQAAGRPGAPRTAALSYFGLDPARHGAGDDYLRRYYAYFGPGVARVLDHVVRTPEAVRDLVATYRAAGCDELFLFPTSADPREVDLLADAVGLAPADAPTPVGAPAG